MHLLSASRGSMRLRVLPLVLPALSQVPGNSTWPKKILPAQLKITPANTPTLALPAPLLFFQYSSLLPRNKP